MTKKEFQDVVGKLSTYRSTAEGAARTVKSHFPKKTSKEYTTAEKYYTVARKSFNKILDESKASLQDGKKIEIPEEDDIQVKEDVEKLVEYSDSLIIKAMSFSPAVILPSLITIFKVIWELYQKWNDDKKKKLLDLLETYRWKYFDEI